VTDPIHNSRLVLASRLAWGVLALLGFWLAGSVASEQPNADGWAWLGQFIGAASLLSLAILILHKITCWIIAAFEH